MPSSLALVDAPVRAVATETAGKMRLPREEDVFGAASEVGFVLLGQGRDGEGVPAESVGIAEIGLQFAANGCDPDQMYTRRNQRQIPKGSVVERERLISRDSLAD